MQATAPAASDSGLGREGRDLLRRSRGATDIARATTLLQQAAARDDVAALHLLATLAGAGIGRPPSWDEAFAHLQRAAELGSPSAQGQLALLGSGLWHEGVRPALPAGTARWAALRERIEPAAWIAEPKKESLRDSPRIRRFPQLIPAPVCDWMIARARKRLVRAQVYDAARGDPAAVGARTNTEADFELVETDVVLLLIRARLAAATRLPPAVMEPTKVLHYAPGEAFAPHYDFIDPATPGYAGELTARGQRLATALVYLNDGFAGGETDFPLLQLRHKGGKGDALVFANLDDARLPDRRTLHAGLPVASGEKWLLSQWIRDRTPAG